MSASHPRHPEQLLALAPVGVHHADAAGMCTWVNDRWCSITGIPAGEACGRPWVDIIAAGDRDRVLAQWLETVARGLEFVCDVRVGGADGPGIEVAVRSVPVCDARGAITGHVAAVTELPDRRHDRMRRLIVENLTDVVLLFDMRRELLYATPSFETLTGRRTEDAVWHVHEALGVHPGDASRMRSLWAGLWEGERYLGAEFRIVSPDGDERWCTSAGAPVCDRDGRQVGVQVRHADVTSRRRIEDRAARVAAAGERADAA
jgi:PAS domain S-box-containing protein